MPRKKRFGTRYFGSLNTKVGPNNLDDTDLQICTNVRRDVYGELSPARETSLVYSIPATDQGAGRGLGVLVRSGSVAITYATDNQVYENGVSIGTSGGAITHRFLGDGTRSYVLNGSDNKVWDGSNYRSHGPVGNSQNDSNDDAVILVGTFDLVVLAATKATTCEITTSLSHHLTTGDSVTFSSMPTGWTALNGNSYTVTVVDADSFTIDVDTSAYTPDYSGTAGRVAANPVTWSGTYNYALAYRITLASGQVIESRLYTCFVDAGGDPGENDSGPITISSGDGILISAKKISQDTIDAWIDDSSSSTVVGVVYRTKDGGNDYYQHSTISELNIVGSGSYYVYDSVSDGAMTVAYLDGNLDHGTPPSGSMGVFCQQRMFVAGVTGYPSRLYYSMIGKYEYFPPTNYVECIDTITAIGRFGEHLMVCTPSGIKMYSPVGAIGQLTDTQSPVGCEHPDSICVTELGTIFCRNDGAWLFDGVTSNRISERIDSLWQESSGTWRGAYIAGHGYFTCGDDVTAKAFDLWKNGDKIEWSSAPFGVADNWSSQPYIAVSGSPDDTYIYGMTADNYVVKIYGGTTYHTMTVKTKAFGDGILRRWIRARIDADSTSSLSVTVATNRGNTISYSIPETSSSSISAQIRTDLPASMLGEECDVTITGKPSVLRSVVLETE